MRAALREFSWMDPHLIIEVVTRQNEPKFVLQKRANSDHEKHVLQFSSSIENLTYKMSSDATQAFTVEQLRLAFCRVTRESTDNLQLIVTINLAGHLSAKLIDSASTFMTETILLSQCTEEDLL